MFKKTFYQLKHIFMHFCIFLIVFSRRPNNLAKKNVGKTQMSTILLKKNVTTFTLQLGYSQHLTILSPLHKWARRNISLIAVIYSLTSIVGFLIVYAANLGLICAIRRFHIVFFAVFIQNEFSERTKHENGCSKQI